MKKGNIIIFINITTKYWTKLQVASPCQQKAKESIVVVSLLSFLWTFYCLFNSQVLIILCSKVQTSSIYFDKVSKKLFVCFQR